MADPNRRDDIINAARHVFAQHGYNKASIKKIARAANLKSSALIYWYFDSKEDLFQAVISNNVPLTRLGEEPDPFFQQPPEIVLPELLRRHLSTLDEQEMRQMLRIMVPEALRDQAIRNNITDLITPIFEMIQNYLAQQIENGRFRPHDTRVSTRTLLAITVIYALNEMLLPDLGNGLPERDYYIEEAVDNFMRGLEA